MVRHAPRYVGGVVIGALLLTLLGGVPASAEPGLPSQEPTAVPSAAPTVEGVAPTDAATPNPYMEPVVADDATPNPYMEPVAAPAAVSGNWVGPWPSTPIPPQQASSATMSNIILQTAPMPTTPGDVAVVAKAQISLSPTKPQQASAKQLATAGGRVSSKVTTVPDAAEKRAGISKAGTKMVISSDTSKLTVADKQAMVTQSPKLTRALVPVNAKGEVDKGLAFRATFQSGERLKFEGTVSPKALEQGDYLVIEKAQVAPDGTIGRFFRTNTIRPDKQGKYEQEIQVRQGLEMVRHRLITREKTVAPKVNWAAIKARAEAILSAEEQALLQAIIDDADKVLTQAEAELLSSLKAAVRTEVKSFVVAHMSLVGTGLMTVNIESMSGSRDITLNWADVPQDGCNPSVTQGCTTSYLSIPLNSGESKTVTFVAPTEKNSFGFSADGINGEKYTLNWSLDPNHTKTCANIVPGPASLMDYGTTWTMQLNSRVQIEGYLSAPTANTLWADEYSKKQNKGETPLGCGFKGTQSFGTWWTNLAGWEKVLIKALATIAVSMATFGAYDAVAAVEVGADVAADLAGDAAADAGAAAAEAAAEDAAESAVEEAVSEELEAAVQEAEADIEQSISEDYEEFAESRKAEIEEGKAELKKVKSDGWMEITGLSRRWKTVFNIVQNQIEGAIIKKIGKDDYSFDGEGVANFLTGHWGTGLVIE